MTRSTYRYPRVCLFALVLVLLFGAGATTVHASTPVPAGLLDPVTETYADDFAEQSSAFPTYRLDLVLDDIESTLGGTLELSYPNLTGETLSELPLRLYPNAGYYSEGQTAIASIDIGDRMVAPRFDPSGTVLLVDLPEPLQPGGTLDLRIEFTTVIPRNSDGSFGILNHDVAGGRFILADWYPVVAGRDESGWRLEPPTVHGDPTFSATGLFEVSLRLPGNYTVVATGIERVMDDGSVRIESGPAREFAMVVTRGMTAHTQQLNETEISVVALPEQSANAQHVLELASAALAFYGEAFGPYPFRELDFVSVPLALAYGVSWSGILFVDEQQMALPAESFASLDFTVLHEIGHQWWGGTVGANSNDHTWMVEGLTNATAILAQSQIQGPAAAANSLYAWVVGPYLNLLNGSGDGAADVSIFDLAPNAPLSTLAYGKGALGFLAIRNAIGADAFMQALAQYADAFRLGIADPEDLLAAFESASGARLGDLWNFWFESAQTTATDVELLVAQIVASL